MDLGFVREGGGRGWLGGLFMLVEVVCEGVREGRGGGSLEGRREGLERWGKGGQGWGWLLMQNLAMIGRL